MEDWELEITAKWQVEDGYVGKDRPQSTIVKIHLDYSHEEWFSMSKEEQMEYIETCVQDDFEQKVSFGVDDYGI